MSDLNINRYDSKYQCVWDFLHVKYGAQLISGLALLGYLISVIGLFGHNYTYFWTYLDLILTIIAIFVYAALFVGIHKTKPQFLRQCLWYLAFEMALLTFLTLLFFLVTAYTSEEYIKEVKPDRYLVLSVTWLLLDIFIFDVIYKCYKYVTEQAASDKEILPESNLDKISLA
uniref:MARVEL domain-containing protein n=1 Tax=Panagrolaimus superbus TaxID=310955 RepID=A0A914XVP6_9BILA